MPFVNNTETAKILVYQLCNFDKTRKKIHAFFVGITDSKVSLPRKSIKPVDKPKSLNLFM